MNAKHLVSGVVLGALLLSPMLSFAQAGTPSVGAREAGTGKATGRVASTTVAERKEEMREKMAERRSAILQRIAERMIRHMEAAIERMEKIATRIDSRIAKLKERGVNTAASEALLATARQKLAAATTAVESAKGAMATALNVALSGITPRGGKSGLPVSRSFEKRSANSLRPHATPLKTRIERSSKRSRA